MPKNEKLVSQSWPIIILVVLVLFSCSRQAMTGYKLVLVLDSKSPTRPFSSEIKAAQFAVEKFNAETNINGLDLDLEILDLARLKIQTLGALQSYSNQLQNDGPVGRALLLGFVMGRKESLALQKFQHLLQEREAVLVGGMASLGARQLNIATPRYESNKYLLQYVVQRRQIDNVYMVYDEEHRPVAEDFWRRSSAAGLKNVVKLRYVNGRSDYNDGSIQSLLELLRNEKAALRNPEGNNGIVLFLKQENIEEGNLYLARSPYRYFFDKFDVFLSGGGLRLSVLSNPDSPRYFVIQRRGDESQRQNYQKFRDEYQKSYHLRASSETAELYDATNLLAYAAKKTIENGAAEEHFASRLYQNLLQAQFAGTTGQLAFNTEGRRWSDYVVFQWTTKALEPQ